MKNRYEVRGELTAIVLRREGGHTIETVIDTEDLPRLIQAPYNWHVLMDRKPGRLYVRGEYQRDLRIHRAKLHRFLIGAPPGYEVDHRNHDTLDNRKSNLRLATQMQNQHNRNGAASYNRTSGVIGVSWHKASNRWRAQIRVCKVNYHLGIFTSKQRAAEVVVEARKRMMPYSEEARLAVAD